MVTLSCPDVLLLLWHKYLYITYSDIMSWSRDPPPTLKDPLDQPQVAALFDIISIKIIAATHHFYCHTITQLSNGYKPSSLCL